jgi:hypothetical protein
MHDPIGMILLQNEQLQLLLSIEWESDINVILSGGGTFTGTCLPVLEFFTTPVDEADYPPLDVIHQIVEDQIPVAATGDYIYTLPRGNVYLQLLLGYGINAAALDSWNRVIMRINQNDILYDYIPGTMDQIVGQIGGYTRTLGTIIFDLLGSDGQGNYGSARDFINTRLLTDLQIVLTTTALATIYAVRRMLLPLGM